MRKGRRVVPASLGAFLIGTLSLGASYDPAQVPGEPPVRLTVEVSWASPAAQSGEPVPVELEMTEGRILEAVAWPGAPAEPPSRTSQGGWRLGSEREGRARARVEAPLDASLVLRAAGQAIRVPLTAVLEAPQQSPTQFPVEIRVERLTWDALMVRLPQGDGTAPPGAKVPVSIGLNLLTPESTELAVRTSAELRPLRGGEVVWREEMQELVTSNRPSAPGRVWEVLLPSGEGTYVLEVRSAWEPVAAREGSRFSRFIRRRRNAPGGSSATRRVTLAVVAPKPPAEPAGAHRAEHDADSLDLGKMRGNRLVASGRAPLATSGGVAWAVPEPALVEPTRRDRLRGWITRAGSEVANLAPADASGLAWSAVGLKVAHPGQPHRLTLKVAGGHPSALGVALVDLNASADHSRLVLDTCASGPPVIQDGPPVTLSWLVWPDTAEPVLVLMNRDDSAPVQLGTVALTELADLPAGPPVNEPASDPRTLGLDLTGPRALERFGAAGGDGNPGDSLTPARRAARYAQYCGATALVLPEALADRAQRQALDGQAAEDATGPDRLDLFLRVLGRQGCSAWLDLDFCGPLPGLPAPEAPESLARGLARLDRHGRPDGRVYHPLNLEVREALRRRVSAAALARKGQTALTGLLVRLGPGPTLLGGPDTGLDDLTYARFVRETFDPETARAVPGFGAEDSKRFDARARFLAGPGRMPWLTWRSRGITALYADLTEAVCKAAPGVTFAVATPGLDDGPAGAEARRADLAGLTPSLAWRAVGLDLDDWPAGETAPIVLRGVSPAAGDLAHDLATSPELDSKVAGRPLRGFLLSDEDRAPLFRLKSEISKMKLEGRKHSLFLTAAPRPEGAAGDELLGHSVAALDARWVLLTAGAVAGREDTLRRFAQAFRALPAPAGGPSPERQAFGVAVRALRSGDKTYLSLANDTPYPILLETVLAAPGGATLDDLGRGLRLTPKATPEGLQLVVELLPYGVYTMRVGAPGAKVNGVTPYPSEVVAASMKAQYDELANQLERLNQNAQGGRGAPPNPGFEPHPSRVVPLSLKTGPVPLSGWELLGSGGSAETDLTHFHSGQGSLKFTAAEPPASVASDLFAPDARGSMTVQAWFRSSQPDVKFRLWIEGKAAGLPYVRRSDLIAQPDWRALAVRASDVPAGGLASARLRFELLTGGSLWVDDLTVTGEPLSETERNNALRALVAAMHAYREQRYADFARLAGSHWARRPGALAGTPADPLSPDRAGMIRTGEATALPAERRLR